jgi:hypothetical protein
MVQDTSQQQTESVQSEDSMVGQPEAQPLTPETPQPTEVSPSEGKPEVRSYPQEEVSKIQSALRKEAQRYKDELELTNAELDEVKAELQILKEEVTAPYTDDEEKTAAQKLRDARILVATERARVAREKADFLKEKTQENEARRKALTERLADKYGVDKDALQKYEDPVEMLHFLAESAPAVKKEVAEKKESLPRPVDSSGGRSRSYEQIEQGYIAGDIPIEEYKEARKQKGLD